MNVKISGDVIVWLRMTPTLIAWLSTSACHTGSQNITLDAAIKFLVNDSARRLDVPTSSHLQATRTMLKLHEKNPIQIRGLECHDVMLPLFPRYSCRELQIFRSDQLETLRHVGQGQRRTRKYEEFLSWGVLANLRCLSELEASPPAPMYLTSLII